jgi:predicted ATP-grasp superfamily ATP-dependent carboligase
MNDGAAAGDRSGRVLVLETHRRQGVVTVRSLGRHGLDITACSDQRLDSGGYSRYVSRRLRIPPPTDESAFLDALEREVRAREYDVLLPLTAATVPVVVKNRERFDPYTTVPYLPYETLRIGLDKYRTARAAREAEVPVPETLAPDPLDTAVVENRLDYPVVVKPRRSAGGFGVHVCDTATELAATFERVEERYGPAVVQEFVPNGGEFGVYTLYDWSSELVGLTVQRRLRTNPPGGGASSLRETVSRPDLVDLADDLFTDLDWQGVAMAEFRVDPRDGEAKLLEINPRFWGSLALSVFAGVDFPAMLYRLATTGRCEPTLDYRVSVQARNLTGDIGHLLARTDTLRALREFFEPASVPRTYDVLAADDPLPGVVHLLRAGRALVGDLR